MEYLEFENLIKQSVAYLTACNAKACRHFGLGEYSRYRCDLERGEIWWSDESEPQVRAVITVVGTISTKSNTWLWSWANPSFRDMELGLIEKVREFGEAQGIQKLVESRWDAQEADGWEMASVAGRLLESQGGYRAPNANGAMFLLFDRLEFIPEDEKEPYRARQQSD